MWIPLLSLGTRLLPLAFVLQLSKLFAYVVFKLAFAIKPLLYRSIYIHTVTSGHILTITIRH